MVETLDRVFYPSYLPEWDNSVGREVLLSLIKKDHTILDVGAGGGIREWTRFRGHAGRVYGVDPDPRVLDNPHLDEACVGLADDLPYPDETFDVAFAWNVAEHLPDPARAFREVSRVLKSGGVFVIKTPNIWHYVTTLSRILPHRLHESLVSRTMRRQTRDIFPTHYRCNSRRKISSLAASSGFRVREIRFLEPRPEYLRFSPITYPFGIAYERIVNSTPLLRQFRVVLVAVLEKEMAGKLSR